MHLVFHLKVNEKNAVAWIMKHLQTSQMGGWNMVREFEQHILEERLSVPVALQLSYLRISKSIEPSVHVS